MVPSSRRKAALLATLAGALSLVAPPALAWPADLSRDIARDARRLVPKSLAQLLEAREAEIATDARATRMKALPLLYADLPQGRLSPSTLAALRVEAGSRLADLQGRSFREGIVALGAMYRLAVDLSDPAISASFGRDPKAADIRREFYLFTAANRDKIPLVVAPDDALRLRIDDLPAFLASAAARTPDQATRLLAAAREEGRVFRHQDIDFRSPVFAVASSAYSRSVTAVAAVWTAIWRAAGGDMTRLKVPATIDPARPR